MQTYPFVQQQREQAALVISIHDVSPQTERVVEVMLKDLKAQGVNSCSLLVIPDHHGRGRISANASFITWLKRQQAEGHEVVLHGYEHRRSARGSDGPLARWITQCYTAGEGEFYDLSYEEAQEKIGQGIKELSGLIDAEAMSNLGFIAPAWLLSSEAERALHDDGFSYTTRLGSVIDLQRSTVTSSQSMVYSVRSEWRRLVSLLWNEGLFFALRKKPLLRLGLHPPDWKYGVIRKHALWAVERALKHRRVMTYASWVDENKSKTLASNRSHFNPKIQ